MAIRKNKKFIDPRYFMDEKTDIVKEAYDPTNPRALSGLEKSMDTGEDYMSPEDLMREKVQDLADKFNVEASVEIANDGKPAILVKHQDGKVSTYNDTEEMYKDLSDEVGRDIQGSHDWYGDESPYDAGY